MFMDINVYGFIGIIDDMQSTLPASLLAEINFRNFDELAKFKSL